METTVDIGPFKDLPVRIHYEPGQDAIRLPHGGGDPGYDPELWIEEVCVQGKWVSAEAFDSTGWLEVAEAHLLQNMGHSLEAEAQSAADERRIEALMEDHYP